MKSFLRFAVVGLVSLLILGATAVLVPGCGGGEVKVLSFYTPDNESAKEFEPVLEKAKEEYEGEVVFEHYDMNDPANKAVIEQYKVEMDPTYIILNTKGEIKQSFLGKPHESMFMQAIAGLIPREAATPSSVPTSMPSQPYSSMPSTPSVPSIPGVK